jgi:hypothetical protein
MSDRATLDELFERRTIYPDVDAQERLARLVGLDGHKARLTKILSLLVNPSGLEAWAKKHHPHSNGVVSAVLRRPPLVVLAGDVGSGKSALAETIGETGKYRRHVISDEPLDARPGPCGRNDPASLRGFRSYGV